MLYTIKKLSTMNFIGWETYEAEIEKQIIALWRDYEKDKIIDARILRKLVQNQIQSYLSDSEEERTKDLELSPEEIVLGLIKKYILILPRLRIVLHFILLLQPFHFWNISEIFFLLNFSKRLLSVMRLEKP